ncbi:DUF3618 domain-containing protein [Nesterenkonia sp. CF4.4]|uniref:DUF3618 domain-containing protein n=1 Tax=Nesterenkonia sp. CF4.4 TaxID=3373079 RepID=UPI003EE73E0E
MTPASNVNAELPRPNAGKAHHSAALPEPEKGASPEQIEADLARTRRELGETVELLVEKFDVKSQAQVQLKEAKHRVAAEIHGARQHAVTYFGRARDFVTDEQGKPNRNGWIGVATVAATAALVLASRTSR